MNLPSCFKCFKLLTAIPCDCNSRLMLTPHRIELQVNLNNNHIYFVSLSRDIGATLRKNILYSFYERLIESELNFDLSTPDYVFENNELKFVDLARDLELIKSKVNRVIKLSSFK